MDRTIDLLLRNLRTEIVRLVKSKDDKILVLEFQLKNLMMTGNRKEVSEIGSTKKPDLGSLGQHEA
jgi:hypothetical protein